MKQQYLAAQVVAPANATTILTDLVGLAFLAAVVILFVLVVRQQGLRQGVMFWLARVGWSLLAGFATSAIAAVFLGSSLALLLAWLVATVQLLVDPIGRWRRWRRQQPTTGLSPVMQLPPVARRLTSIPPVKGPGQHRHRQP
jgi:hypothetical protein